MRHYMLAVCVLLALSAVSPAQDFRDEWPRIMVVVDEKIDGSAVDASTVATRIEEIFLEKGFRLVDKSQFENVRARDVELAEGNPARAKELGLRYGAELIIVGKSEGSLDAEKDFYGVRNYQYASKGSVKVIRTDTGEMIAVSSQNAKKSATGRTSAADQTMGALGTALANDLYVKVRVRLKKEAEGPRIWQMAMIGIDEKGISRYEKALPQDHPLINYIKLRYLEKDGAVFDVSFNGTIDELRNTISKREDLVVISFTGSRLDVSTKEAAERAKGSAMLSSPLEITQFTVENIFPSQVNYYAYNPLATIEVENGAKTEIRNVKVSVFIPEFMNLPSEEIVPKIDAGAKQSFKLSATLDAQKLYTLNANAASQAKVELSYVFNNQPQTRSLVRPVTIYNRNTISWRRGESVGSFVTESDDAVVAFSRYVVGAVAGSDALRTKLPRPVMYAMSVWNGIRALGINYVSDPWKSSENDILDQIQYPRETLASRTGDCDDSSVLLAAALENIGLRTKLIGTSDHIFMMFDTELSEKNGYMVSMNDKDYVIHEGRVWIPLETTMINEPFVKAWTSGAAGYHDRVAKGEKLELIDVRKAKEMFPPANLPPTARPSAPPSERIVQLISRDLTDYNYYQTQLVSADVSNLASSSDPNAKLRQAITFAKAGDYDAAVTTLGTPSTAGAYNTLGNIFILKNDLPKAQEYFQRALELDNTDGGVYLNFGLARFLADDTTGAVESFQAAISKFESPDQAYAVLGIDKMQEALGMRAADAGEKKVAKADIFALLNRSLTALPSKQSGTVQADRVRQRYKDQQNKYVFGGRRGADPTQIASIKEFLYWME